MPSHVYPVRKEVDIHEVGRPSILKSYKTEKEHKTKLLVTGALR